jgi:deazaflavin-dependent oxidoreductase (nitroreductase family)
MPGPYGGGRQRSVNARRTTIGSVDATLVTTGRRSGAPRPVKLYVWPDGDDRFVLVGSTGGGDKDPAWVHNLRADPRCSLRFGKDDRPGHVHEVAPGPERERLWTMVVAAFRYYATYQRKTTRLIPLFVFEPDAPGP